MHAGQGSPVAISGLSRSPYTRIAGVGSFSALTESTLGAQTRRQADFLFIGRGPGSPSNTYLFQLSTSATPSGGASYGPLTSMPNPEAAWQLASPR
jgi:hypothetical protein